MSLTGLTERVQPVRVPHGHDLTGFHASGGDLRAWLLERWKRVQMVAPERKPAKDEEQADEKELPAYPAAVEGRSR